MWKKALPLLVLSGVLLVGCTNNDTIRDNNDTPMEDVRDDAREIKDDVERDFEGRDHNDGTINEDTDNGTMNEDMDKKDEIRKGDTNYDPEIDENGNVD